MGIARYVASVSASKIKNVVHLFMTKQPIPGTENGQHSWGTLPEGGGGVSAQTGRPGPSVPSWIKTEQTRFVSTLHCQGPAIPSLPPSLTRKRMPNSGKTIQLSNQGEWRMVLGSNFFCRAPESQHIYVSCR